MARCEGREVSVVSVVRCVDVPVSSATMIFEGSMALDGGGPTRIGLKRGGKGDAVMCGGSAGTETKDSEDRVLSEGGGVGLVAATGFRSSCSNGMGGRSGLFGGVEGNFLKSSSSPPYSSTSAISECICIS